MAEHELGMQAIGRQMEMGRKWKRTRERRKEGEENEQGSDMQWNGRVLMESLLCTPTKHNFQLGMCNEPPMYIQIVW